MANIPASADDSIAATNDKQTPIPTLLVKEQALPELDTSQNGSRPTEDTAGDSQGCEPEYVTGVKLVLVVASVALACFLMLVDTMVISTAIPQITDQFHSLPDVGWYASAYQFGIAAPQPIVGKIYTCFRTKVGIPLSIHITAPDSPSSGSHSPETREAGF
jgi:hypothetical protein